MSALAPCALPPSPTLTPSHPPPKKKQKKEKRTPQKHPNEIRRGPQETNTAKNLTVSYSSLKWLMQPRVRLGL